MRRLVWIQEKTYIRNQEKIYIGIQKTINIFKSIYKEITKSLGVAMNCNAILPDSATHSKHYLSKKIQLNK